VCKTWPGKHKKVERANISFTATSVTRRISAGAGSIGVVGLIAIGSAARDWYNVTDSQYDAKNQI